MAITLQTKRISAGATRVVSVSFLDWLEGLGGTALLTGTPTIVEVTTSVLTLANKAINTATVLINHSGRLRSVIAGKAVQFSVVTPSNGSGTTYRVRITATTNSTPAESEPMDVLLECV